MPNNRTGARPDARFGKQGYLKIAAALKAVKPAHPNSTGAGWREAQWEVDCNAIADLMASGSAAFNREEFLDNCGFEPEVIGNVAT